MRNKLLKAEKEERKRESESERERERERDGEREGRVGIERVGIVDRERQTERERTKEREREIINGLPNAKHSRACCKSRLIEINCLLMALWYFGCMHHQAAFFYFVYL